MKKVANDSPSALVAQTRDEVRALAGQRQVWLGLAGTGVIIGLGGPFGTFDAVSLPVRIAYWLAVVVTSFWIGYAVSFVAAIWAESRGLAPLWSAGLGAAVASLPVTGWLAGLHTALFAAEFWADAGRLLPYVLVISVALTLLSDIRSDPAIEPVPRPAPPQAPAWLDQLPAHLGRDLILLQAQDHYVRAETALGDTLIRARLQDAAEDLGAYGVRLHRSWWVSRSAIRAMLYRNGAPVAVLHDGRVLPVGRTYRRAVREVLR